MECESHGMVAPHATRKGMVAPNARQMRVTPLVQALLKSAIQGGIELELGVSGSSELRPFLLPPLHVALALTVVFALALVLALALLQQWRTGARAR